MNYNFNVVDLYLSCTNSRKTIISDSVEVHSAVFTFSSEWDGYNKTATFTNTKTGVSASSVLVLDETTCLIPWEPLLAIADGGYLEVCLQGINGNSRKYTRMANGLIIQKSSQYCGTTQPDPSPTVYEQILTLLGEKADNITYDNETNLLKLWSGTVELASVYIASGGGSDTPQQILAKLLTVDGVGSGLDADLLQGKTLSEVMTIPDLAVSESKLSQDVQDKLNLVGDVETTIADNSIITVKTVSNFFKNITWVNLKLTLKTYFDTLYNNYVLPKASSSVLGGIKVGTNLSIDADGVLSASGGATIPIMTTSVNGIGKPDGTNLTVDGNGTFDLSSSIKTKIPNWDTAYTNTHTHANKVTLDLVSGTNTGDETNSTILTKIGYTPENLANKNQALGYCGLDSGGKVPSSALPTTLLQYIGVWNASTNTPTLTNPDVTKISNVYTVSVAGTQFGIAFKVGDWLIYNASGVPEKSDNSDDVTSVNGKTGVVVLTTSDIADSLDKRYVTDAQKTVITNTSGTNSGNETTTTIGTLINGATAKTTPIDADMVGLMDSASSNVIKKLSWLNVKATLKTYFDTLYNLYTLPTATTTVLGGIKVNGTNTTIVSQTLTISDATTSLSGLESASDKTKLNGIDDNANNYSLDNAKLSAVLSASTEEITIVDSDTMPFTDTSATNETKKLSWLNVKSNIKTYFDTLYPSITDYILDSSSSGTVSKELVSGKTIKISTVLTSLTLTLPATTTWSDNYSIEFSTASLTLPSGVVWDGGTAPTLSATKWYILTIFDGVALISQGATK